MKLCRVDSMFRIGSVGRSENGANVRGCFLNQMHRDLDVHRKNRQGVHKGSGWHVEEEAQLRHSESADRFTRLFVKRRLDKLALFLLQRKDPVFHGVRY